MSGAGVCAVGILVVGAGTAVAQGEPLVMPSGVEARPHDTIWDEDLSMIRMRFVVPRLSEPGSLYAGDSLRVFEDMLWLCETQIARTDEELDDLRAEGWSGVVISLMDRPIEFGVRDTEVFQVFEGFALTMDGCDLELDIYHD